MCGALEWCAAAHLVRRVRAPPLRRGVLQQRNSADFQKEERDEGWARRGGEELPPAQGGGRGEEDPGPQSDLPAVVRVAGERPEPAVDELPARRAGRRFRELGRAATSHEEDTGGAPFIPRVLLECGLLPVRNRLDKQPDGPEGRTCGVKFRNRLHVDGQLILPASIRAVRDTAPAASSAPRGGWSADLFTSHTGIAVIQTHSP